MKKIIITIVLLLLLFTACSKRTVVEGEILLSEVVYEENGYYYKLSPPNTKLVYTGTSISYHHGNGQKKGSSTVVDGLPHGIWKYWDRDGNFEYALHFDKGKLIKRELP